MWSRTTAAAVHGDLSNGTAWLTAGSDGWPTFGKRCLEAIH
jgi:hypothetical protein